MKTTTDFHGFGQSSVRNLDKQIRFQILQVLLS